MKKILILSGLVLSFAFATTAMADTMTVVSDTSVSVYGPLDHYAAIGLSDWSTPASAVVTWKHPSWPTITGANWISTAYYTENPVISSWRLFEDVITLPSCATNISENLNLISVTSDNAEEVYLNGALIGHDGEVEGTAIDNQEWKSVLNYPLTGLQAGANALQIIVRNYAQSGGTAKSNPTGLIYKADVTYDINPDCDEDGVLDVNDKCLGTATDEPEVKLGVNRHVWSGGDYFKTLVPGKKGAKIEAPSPFSLTDTYGCSCEQILEKMKDATGFDFKGHDKYGCSKSIIEDWIAGEYYVGPTFVETVEVPATNNTGIDSVNILESGKSYLLKVYGTYRFANWGDYGVADAEYAYRNDAYALPLPPDGWTLGENSYPSILGLDVQVDGNNVYWGDYNSAHVYTYTYAGTGNLVHFHIYDSAYGDNSGSLTVDIFEDKWVDLW